MPGDGRTETFLGKSPEDEGFRKEANFGLGLSHLVSGAEERYYIAHVGHPREEEEEPFEA